MHKVWLTAKNSLLLLGKLPPVTVKPLSTEFRYATLYVIRKWIVQKASEGGWARPYQRLRSLSPSLRAVLIVPYSDVTHH